MRCTRTMLAALLVCGTPFTAHAQSGVTLKGGFSYGDVSNRDLIAANLGTRKGFAVGASVGTPGLLGFRIEGLYAQRGVESRSLDYVDVPVTLQASLPLLLVSPYAYAGPQASFEVRCRDNGVACADTARPKTSYAAVVGAGVKLSLPALPALSLEARYVYGLTDLKLGTITSTSSYQTRSFLILAGVGF